MSEPEPANSPKEPEAQFYQRPQKPMLTCPLCGESAPFEDFAPTGEPETPSEQELTEDQILDAAVKAEEKALFPGITDDQEGEGNEH